jgi:hypothetical protein
MACDGLLSADILFDCDNPPVGGIEVNVLLVNSADIDRASVTFDPTNKIKMTNFQLKAAKTGFVIQGVKQVQKANSELVVKETGVNKHKHTFTGIALNCSAANKLQLQNMSENGSLVAIVETKWKGEANADAFTVLGYSAGLEMATMTWGTAENDGSIMFTLASLANYEEPTLPLTLLETSYALTKTAFDNAFLED